MGKEENEDENRRGKKKRMIKRDTRRERRGDNDAGVMLVGGLPMAVSW